MSRVDAVKVAVMKAGEAAIPARRRSPPRTRSSRSATASTRIAAAGATAVVQPGGSVRDAEVIAAADEHGLAMVFTGEATLQALRR